MTDCMKIAWMVMVCPLLVQGAGMEPDREVVYKAVDGCEENGENLKTSSVPNMMILYNPVLDTTEDGFGAERFPPEKQMDLSLCHQVKPGIVPTLLFHGTEDKTVPYENAERFARLMKEAGNDCVLVPFEGKGHGFFNGSFFRERNGDDAFNETMNYSIDFLSSHVFLEYPEGIIR